MTAALIALSGIDASGKSTQLRLLADWLRASRPDVCVTRQPTDFYRGHPSVRNYFRSRTTSSGMYELVLLSALDRQLHLRTCIEPALRAGSIVVTDRYYYSAEAFFFARGVDRSIVRAANRSIPMPQLTIFLDLPISECHRRIEARGDGWSSEEEKDMRFLERVREGFLGSADDSFVVVDAMQSVERIFRGIQAEVRALGVLP